jgi:hypothetical protein
MKNTIRAYFVLILFLALSCNKDQQAIKRLEGKWKQNKLNGQVVSEEQSSIWTISPCKLKNDELCSVSSQIGNETVNYKFLIRDNGKTFVMKNGSGTTTIQTYTIDYLDKSTLRLVHSTGISSITTEYKKI